MTDPEPRVRLIHWDAEEASERAAGLRASGYAVDFAPFAPAALRSLKANPPSAVVIDLSRLPSGGRDVGMALRKSKTTRGVPVVFVGGDPEKVARVREQLPDATYTDWATIRRALPRAIANPPPVSIVPRSRLEGYAGTPLPKKLGIKPGSTVALIGRPQGFDRTLRDLREAATVRYDRRGRSDLTIWFPRSRRDLETGIARMARSAEGGGLWIAWPKRASGAVTDLSEPVVRRVALATGLVDFKICSINAIWSGLRFTRRTSRQ